MIKQSFGAAMMIALGVTTSFGQIDLKGGGEKKPGASEKPAPGAKPGGGVLPGAGVPGIGGTKPTPPPTADGAKPASPPPKTPSVEAPAAGGAKPANLGNGKAPSGNWGGSSKPLDLPRGGVDAAGKAIPPQLNKNGKDAAADAANRNPAGAPGKEGAAADRPSPKVSGDGAKAGGFVAIKSSFRDRNIYTQDWYHNHPQAWLPPRLSTGTVWAATNYGVVVGYLGYSNRSPISYGYGNNVNFQNGVILIDGRNVGTAVEYSQQAASLAARGDNIPTADSDEWLPLGVYGLVRDENQQAQATLQMVINKQGILRGNYQDAVTDLTLPIQGAVQEDTQRAAWTIGGKDNFLMEAGLVNLTEGEAPTLIHKNGETDRWWMVRLDPPSQ